MISMSKRGEPRKSYNPLNGTTAEDIYFDPHRAVERTKLSGGKGLSEKSFVQSNTIWFYNTISANGTASVCFCRYKPDPEDKEPHFKLDIYDCDDVYFKGKPHWISDEEGYKLTSKAIEKSLDSHDINERIYAEEVLQKILSYGNAHPMILALKDKKINESDCSENP